MYSMGRNYFKCLILLFIIITLSISDSLKAEEDTKLWIRETGSMDNNAVVDDKEAPFTEDIVKLSKFAFTPGKDGRSASSSVIINGDKAYYTSYDQSAHKEYENKVYCRNKETNDLIWEFVTDKPRNRSGHPNTADPKCLSEFFLQGVCRAPLLYKDKIFFGTFSGTFYCLNADNGELIWSIKHSHQNNILALIQCSPIAFENNVYFGVSYPLPLRGKNKEDMILVTYQIYQCDIDTGKVVSKYEAKIEAKYAIASVSTIKTNLSINNGKLFAGVFGNLVCFDAKNITNLLWKFYIGGNYPYTSSPTALDDKVYFGTAETDFFCLSVKDGKIIWRTHQKYGIRCTTSIAIKDERIYFGARDSNIYCLSSKDGSIIWQYKTPESVLSTPVVSGKRLFVGIYGHELLCINTEDGKLLKSYDAKNTVTSTVAISDGKIYFGTDEGVVYCFGEKPTKITIQAKPEMKVGETQVCVIKSYNENNKEYNVHLKLSVEPEEIAVINSDGKLTANKAGKCYIIASCNGISVSAEINIKE